MSHQRKRGTPFFGAPILRDGVLYTLRGGAEPGAVAATLLALRASDGGEIWRAALDSTPLAMDVADGQVYMLLKYHEDASLVRVFDASDGAPKQQFTLPIFTGFVVTNGLIIGCDSYLYLYNESAANTSFAAYHASDGSLAWQASALAETPAGGGPSPCALALGNGVLYQAAEKSGGVTAVRVSDGKPVWQAQIESVVALGLSSERLIAASVPNLALIKSGQSNLTSEKFTAFDLKDGHVLWQRDFPLTEANGPYISATIAADDERAYVATKSGLRVFRLSDGATVWERKTGGDTPFYSYPVVAQGTLFALNGYYPVYEYPLAQRNHAGKPHRRAERGDRRLVLGCDGLLDWLRARRGLRRGVARGDAGAIRLRVCGAAALLGGCGSRLARRACRQFLIGEGIARGDLARLDQREALGQRRPGA